MIMGECPHCGEYVSTPMGPAPCYSKEICPHCKKEYWLKHSRIQSIAYTDKPKEVGKKIIGGEKTQ